MQKSKCKMQNCGGPSGRLLFVASSERLLITTKMHKKALYLSFIVQNVQKFAFSGKFVNGKWLMVIRC